MARDTDKIYSESSPEAIAGSRWWRVFDAVLNLTLVKALSNDVLGGLFGFGKGNDTPLCAVDVSKGEVRLQKGTNIASAATIAPAVGSGQVFHVTGVVTIDNITPRYSGDVLHLIADGAWAFSAIGNIKAGTSARSVNDLITLVCDGTNWYEDRGAASGASSLTEAQVTNLVADLAAKLTTASCSGAVPPDSAKATHAYNGGADAVLTVVAKTAGVAGNSITLTFVSPAPAINQAFGVVVAGTDITVNLATDGVGALVDDANTVRTNVLLDAGAAALIDITANVGPNGTGIMGAVALAALTGGRDTTALSPARFYIDTANDDFWYSNLTAWVKVV